MASQFQVQKPYVLTTLPRPLDLTTGTYVVGEVYGYAPGSKKRKRRRAELTVGIDGEAINIYDVSLLSVYIYTHIALHPLYARVLSCAGLLLEARHIISHPPSVAPLLPSQLRSIEIRLDQGCLALHLRRIGRIPDNQGHPFQRQRQ